MLGILPPAATLVVSPKLQAKHVIVHPEKAIAAALDRIGSHHTDLLRHHADIGLLASVIGEAVVAQSIFQMTQRHDVVLAGS